MTDEQFFGGPTGQPLSGAEWRADGSMSPPITSDAPAPLYKAQVRVRWRNRLTNAYTDIAPGTAVEFDAGDFNADGGGLALVSLEDVLARGLFVPWSAEDAGNVATMSRDEMLELLRSINEPGPGEDGAWPHNIEEAELRPILAAVLERRTNPPDEQPPSRRTRPWEA